MEKQIYDKNNGLSYTLHGDYYIPDLKLNEEEPTYGKYGVLRKEFLKEYRSAKYQYLLLTGKLPTHLNQVDQGITAVDAAVQKDIQIQQEIEGKFRKEQVPRKMSDRLQWARERSQEHNMQSRKNKTKYRGMEI